MGVVNKKSELSNIFTIKINNNIFEIKNNGKQIFKNDILIYDISKVSEGCMYINFAETNLYLIATYSDSISFYGFTILNKDGSLHKNMIFNDRQRSYMFSKDNLIIGYYDDSGITIINYYDIENETVNKIDNNVFIDDSYDMVLPMIFIYDIINNLFYCSVYYMGVKGEEYNFKYYLCTYDKLEKTINKIEENIDYQIMYSIGNNKIQAISNQLSITESTYYKYLYNNIKYSYIDKEDNVSVYPITFTPNSFLYRTINGIYELTYTEPKKIKVKLSTSEEIFDTIEVDTESVITKFEVNTITNNFSLRFYNNENLVFETNLNKPVSQIQYVDKLIYENVEYDANTSNWEKTTIPLSNDLPQESELTIHIGDKIRYLIQFINEDISPRTLLERQRVYENVTPTYTQDTPTKEGYIFIGWTPTLYPANKNQDYIATFELTPIDYTLIFKDSNNEQFTPSTYQFKNYITRILFNNDLFGNPYIYIQDLEGEKTINFSYTNKGLTTRIKIASITINGTTYNQLNTYYDINIEDNTEITLNSEVEYYIEFRDYNQMPLQTKWVKANTTPTYTGLTPSRTGYNFIGWTPTLYPANKTQIYIATYEIIKYTIRFLNEDKSVLETKEVNYGVTPTYTGTTPTKEGYTFIGWTPNLYPATQNQDYIAVFRNNAFAINLYKNTAENNRVDKNSYLTQVGEIEGYLRDETSIINPTIVIEYNKVIDFNYIYISTFNRYYFVNEVQSVRTNLWRLSLSCDVLMTYKDIILNYECYVSRNEYDYNEDIEDKYLPLEYEKVVDYINQNDTTGGKTNFFKGFSALFTTLATSEEVNLESENININTPFLDEDGETATTNIYEVGSSNFKVVQMITDVGAYASCLNTIANALIQDNVKASFVQSIIVFPIWNTAIYEQVGYKTMTDFYYGSEKLSLGGSYNIVLKGDTIAPILIATINVQRKFNNFLDYDPYTNYEIWLPFYGWAKLPSELVVGEILNVYYVINTSSTKGTIIVKNSGTSAVILQVDCTIGVEIPISATNNEDINRKVVSNGINLAVQGLGGTLMAMGGAVLGNPLALIGGASMAIGSITGAISSGMTNRVEAQGKVSDGNAGLYSDRVVKIRRTSPNLAVDDISKYAKYIGRPLQTNVVLNTLFGYTIVGGVHVENLPIATESEKNEIDSLLRKGVLLKDKTN